ncbi:Transposon Tf2-9 polyprotein [Eumeta japonica]|uniref:Transposon Tf2-9 polyprotein n=1 Tax=Eumeta variegata TaxID=151549 RepID=A0A4C1W5E2_EUMVA|nr:Transposon Tf2-9 polyprotein [Eumeta japonica]
MKLTSSALDPALPHAAEGTTRTAVSSKDQWNGNRGVVEPQRIQIGFAFITCGSETKHGSAPNHTTGHRKRKTKRANGTEIKTYGLKTLVVDLGLRRSFRWTFVIADVKQHILGADFLSHFKLLVDLSNRWIVDQVTKLKTIAGIDKTAQLSASTLDKNIPYLDLLSEFPNITKPISFKETPSHSVVHYIETTGLPVFVKARPLQLDCYRRVKEEFQTMMNMEICGPSKSPWASLLHVVPKKDGQSRSCTDYRCLNAVTKPDSRLDTYGITINLSKCAFEKDEIDFLGYEVSTSGISPLEEKVKAIVAYPRPKTIVELCRFPGMLIFYRSHLPKAAEYQAILNKHINGAKKKDKTPIDWTPDDERAFEKCMVSLQSAVTLSHPLADASLGLMTDAFNTAVGAVLQQFVDNSLQPLGLG